MNAKRRFVRSLQALVWCSLAATLTPCIGSTEQPSPALSTAAAAAKAHPNRFVGVGSCSSSNCHGSATARSGSAVLQNEYYIWAKHDRHSQAYAVLSNPDSRRMAELLGIADPQHEPTCLRCHSTYVPDPAHRKESFQVEDGVACESCHGAAEGWLATHTEAHATHAQNVTRGLTDLVPLAQRAKVCLECHQGTSEQAVTHTLYGAGHPRLSFELDTFGALQPRHWVVDTDYEQRKERYIPARAWLLGQLVQAREALALLNSPQRAWLEGLPELSIFDCYSCHHSLSEKQWRTRKPAGKPGRLKLNLPALTVLQSALSHLDPPLARKIQGHLATLHTGFNTTPMRAAVEALDRLLREQVKPQIEALELSPAHCATLLKGLLSLPSTAHAPTYEVAEQVAMGMQAVLATAEPLRSQLKAHLDQILASLAHPDTFAPAPFLIQVQSARELLR